MKAYIAGKMRRRPFFNFPAFFECEQYLLGLNPTPVVFNPARHDADGGFPWKDCPEGSDEELARHGFDIQKAMAADLAWITTKADTIVMLPGWSESTGAKLEKQVAETVGCEVLYYNTDVVDAARLSSIPWGEEVQQPPLSVSEEAARTVGERRLSYGSPRQDFERAADLFYYASGEKHLLSAPEIAVLQMCVKLSRRVTSPEKRDHMVDIAGYADCYWQVMEDTDA